MVFVAAPGWQDLSRESAYEDPLQSRIDLNDAPPLISGAYRDVYQHPLDDNLLVKVVRPSFIELHAQRTYWSKLWSKDGYYRMLTREVGVYLALRRRGQHTLPFIQHFTGVVDTNLGLGMVVRKVRGSDGAIAPSLASRVQREGLTQQMRNWMADLAADVVRHHIVFGDVNGYNVVCADDEEHGKRVVIVDGLSDHLLIPVNSWSFSANKAFSGRRFATAMRGLEKLDRIRRAELLLSHVDKG